MGGRGGGSGMIKATASQKQKMENIKKAVAKNKFSNNDLKFTQMKNGTIGFSYTEERTVYKEKGGKMQSPDKADVYLRTTVKSGVILKDGLIKHNKDKKEEKLIKKGKR